MTKSQAAALIAAAIQAAKRADPHFPSIDRTAPDADRIEKARAKCTREAFEDRFVTKLCELNATGKHSLDETKCYAKERVVRSRLQRSERNQPERAAEKFDLMAVCEFLHGPDGCRAFTSDNDMVGLCDYDWLLARFLSDRLKSANLVVQTISYDLADPSRQVSGLMLTDYAIHLLMTKATGKVARDVLLDIENEEAA